MIPVETFLACSSQSKEFASTIIIKTNRQWLLSESGDDEGNGIAERQGRSFTGPAPVLPLIQSGSLISFAAAYGGYTLMDQPTL
jgi:hypothetical protein